MDADVNFFVFGLILKISFKVGHVLEQQLSIAVKILRGVATVVKDVNYQVIDFFWFSLAFLFE
jgi:hypothetical protein